MMGPEAVELDIHIHNDFQLWKMHEAIEANLAKKIVRGVYSPVLAVKGWLNLVDRAAKSYARDNSMPPEAFDARMRKSLALEFERRFYRDHIGMYKASVAPLSADPNVRRNLGLAPICSKCGKHLEGVGQDRHNAMVHEEYEY